MTTDEMLDCDVESVSQLRASSNRDPNFMFNIVIEVLGWVYFITRMMFALGTPTQ